MHFVVVIDYWRVVVWGWCWLAVARGRARRPHTLTCARVRASEAPRSLRRIAHNEPAVCCCRREEEFENPYEQLRGCLAADETDAGSLVFECTRLLVECLHAEQQQHPESFKTDPSCSKLFLPHTDVDRLTRSRSCYPGVTLHLTKQVRDGLFGGLEATTVCCARPPQSSARSPLLHRSPGPPGVQLCVVIALAACSVHESCGSSVQGGLCERRLLVHLVALAAACSLPAPSTHPNLLPCFQSHHAARNHGWRGA